MAGICDELGNPIQLTDEHGRQVQLTDEHGVPVHLTGVATTVDSVQQNVGTTTVGSESKMHGGTHFAPTAAEPVVGDVVETTVPGGQPPCHPGVDGAEGGTQQQLGSCSSSSSEDDGEGGRRRKKKKGLMQKIKEKLPGHKNKEEIVPEKVYTATTKVTVTTPAGPLDAPKTERIRVEHHEEEHEKEKGFIDKIMDKLPGHH